MARTYTQIQKQIEQLQREAEPVRSTEVKGVIDRIKIAIAHYGLTAAHLGLSGASRTTSSKRSAKASPQFGDGSGNTWSGRGPRPRWLREALAAGRSIEEFRSNSGTKSNLATKMEKAQSPASTKKVAAKKTKRAPSTINYSDDAGNSWTGRGPKPGWLKAALDGGKTLQDFAKAA